MSCEGGPILPVVLCGGAGTRLWPLSRDSMPKPFIPLLGDRSLFQATLQRVIGGGAFLRPVVIAGHDVRFVVAEQLAEIGACADIILEPIQRDTAAAVAVAACHAARRHPEATVLILAADHVIEDAAAFSAACETAAVAAQGGFIMTLGVSPHIPATGYGYIKPGERLAASEARHVESFIEKPGREAAQEFVANGFLWNSGNFLFRPDVMIAELERFQPALLAAAREALDRAVVDLDFIRLDEIAFAQAPKIAIDRAVMERTDRAGVLPVSFAWSDIGSWDSLWTVLPRDEAGNALRGKAEAVESRNSLILSDTMLVTVVGLEDAVVVASRDAVLVTLRSRAENVKDLVASLRAKEAPEVRNHSRAHRPWGWHHVIEQGPGFQAKRLMVKPGGRLSRQKHRHRHEHWVVVRGVALVELDGDTRMLSRNGSAYIPAGAIHRLSNPGPEPLEVIEVQVGAYMGEDDIVRLEDDYGREDRMGE